MANLLRSWLQAALLAEVRSAVLWKFAQAGQIPPSTPAATPIPAKDSHKFTDNGASITAEIDRSASENSFVQIRKIQSEAMGYHTTVSDGHSQIDATLDSAAAARLEADAGCRLTELEGAILSLQTFRLLIDYRNPSARHVLLRIDKAKFIKGSMRTGRLGHPRRLADTSEFTRVLFKFSKLESAPKSAQGSPVTGVAPKHKGTMTVLQAALKADKSAAIKARGSPQAPSAQSSTIRQRPSQSPSSPEFRSWRIGPSKSTATSMAPPAIPQRPESLKVKPRRTPKIADTGLAADSIEIAPNLKLDRPEQESLETSLSSEQDPEATRACQPPLSASSDHLKSSKYQVDNPRPTETGPLAPEKRLPDSSGSSKFPSQPVSSSESTNAGGGSASTLAKVSNNSVDPTLNKAKALLQLLSYGPPPPVEQHMDDATGGNSVAKPVASARQDELSASGPAALRVAETDKSRDQAFKRLGPITEHKISPKAVPEKVSTTEAEPILGAAKDVRPAKSDIQRSADTAVKPSPTALLIPCVESPSVELRDEPHQSKSLADTKAGSQTQAVKDTVVSKTRERNSLAESPAEQTDLSDKQDDSTRRPAAAAVPASHDASSTRRPGESSEDSDVQQQERPVSSAQPTSLSQHVCSVHGWPRAPHAKYLKYIRRRIPKDQDKLLSKEASWIPSNIGASFPPSNVPISVLEALVQQRIDQDNATKTILIAEEPAGQSLEDGHIVSNTTAKSSTKGLIVAVDETSDAEDDQDGALPWSSSPPARPTPHFGHARRRSVPQTDHLPLDSSAIPPAQDFPPDSSPPPDDRTRIASSPPSLSPSSESEHDDQGSDRDDMQMSLPRRLPLAVSQQVEVQQSPIRNSSSQKQSSAGGPVPATQIVTISSGSCPDLAGKSSKAIAIDVQTTENRDPEIHAAQSRKRKGVFAPIFGPEEDPQEEPRKFQRQQRRAALRKT